MPLTNTITYMPMTYSFTLLMKISKLDDPKAIGNQEQNIISVAEHF